MATREYDPVLDTHMRLTGRRMPDQQPSPGGNMDRVGQKSQSYDLDIDETPTVVAVIALIALGGLIGLKLVGFRFVFGVTAGGR